MTKTQINELIGQKVEVIFKDNSTQTGILGYTEEFSSKYGYRKPGYFTINEYDFKVSHIRKVKPL